MKKIIVLLAMITIVSCKESSNETLPTVITDSETVSEINAKPISEDFIKKDLYNPATADFSLFDATQQVDGNIYRILRKVSAKNSLGVEREYIYEVKLEYLGGNEYDVSNWKLVSIRSEEYK